MKLRLAAALAGVVATLGLQAAAHHSFSATYHIVALRGFGKIVGAVRGAGSKDFDTTT